MLKEQFSDRGVSVLHIISNPFPDVWHNLGVGRQTDTSSELGADRLQDDASALSLPAMRRWNSILRVFASEYLGLSPEAGGARAQEKRSHPSLSELVRCLPFFDYPG